MSEGGLPCARRPTDNDKGWFLYQLVIADPEILLLTCSGPASKDGDPPDHMTSSIE